MFINDILLKNIFFQSLLCFSVFVLACEENYSPGVGCTVDESLPEFRGGCDFKQCIPNKPTIWYVLFKATPSFIWSHLPLFGHTFLYLVTPSFIWFLRRFTKGLELMLKNCQFLPKLCWI